MWQQWNRSASYRITEIQGVGAVESWVELTDVSRPLVGLRWTWVFASDGQVLTSDSTLRFRERDEVEAALIAHGYDVDEVSGAPDRPGREFVFFARRPGEGGRVPVDPAAATDITVFGDVGDEARAGRGRADSSASS